MRSETRRALVAGAVMLPLAGAVTFSAVEGAVHPYPGVALGSGALLVTERALLLWGFWLFVLNVLFKAVNGRLPHERLPRGFSADDESTAPRRHPPLVVVPEPAAGRDEREHADGVAEEKGAGRRSPE